MAEIQMTIPVVKVLRAFLSEPENPRYGMELMKETKLKSGTIYPVLLRLERAGWIVGAAEDIDPRVAGRPPRRNYTLTAEGARAARIQLAELNQQLRGIGNVPGRLSPAGT